MNLLFSCIGRRGYLATWFREALGPGDRIVGTTNTPWTPGLQACDRAVLMPDLADPAYLPTLLDVCRTERIDALLSFLDLDVDLLARNRDALLDAGVVPIVPDAGASQTCLDKLETDRFLRRAGFGSPLTFGICRRRSPPCGTARSGCPWSSSHGSASPATTCSRPTPRTSCACCSTTRPT